MKARSGSGRKGAVRGYLWMKKWEAREMITAKSPSYIRFSGILVLGGGELTRMEIQRRHFKPATPPMKPIPCARIPPNAPTREAAEKKSATW